MASLIDAQQPDADGKVIPRGTSEGRAVVSSPKGLNTKITFALSSSAFSVTTATCCPNCTCCFGTFNVYMSPSSATVAVNGTTQLHFMDNEWGGVTDDSCDATWSSDNTSVGTVSTPDCLNSGGVVTGVAAGGVGIQASEIVNPSGQICSCSPGCPGQQVQASAGVGVTPIISSISPAQGLIGSSQTVTISGAGLGSSPSVNGGSGISASINSASSTQINATLSVSSSATGGNNAISVTSGGQTSNQVSFYIQVPTGDRIVQTAASYQMNASSSPRPCPVGQQGWDRLVVKIVTDQNSPSSDIAVANQYLSENVTINSGANGLNLSAPQTGNEYTANGTNGAAGTYNDELFFCSSYCPSVSETDMTQATFDQPPASSVAYQLSPNNAFKYTCSGNYINNQ